MQDVPLKSCNRCGTCCRLFLINLTQYEWLSGTYQTELKGFDAGDDFDFVQEYGGNILSQKDDGSCIYLENTLCSIHTRRPESCRDFSCESTAKEFKGMIQEVEKRKRQVDQNPNSGHPASKI